MSFETFCSITFAYIWVVLILVCPKSLETVAMGTPLVKVTVVAKVCRAMWKDKGFSMPQKSAISFR